MKLDNQNNKWIQAGHLGVTIQLFNRLNLFLNCFFTTAWGNLGNILNAQHRHAEAEAAYRHALHFRSNMADVHYNLGILLQELGRRNEAIESYQKAITCRPKLTGKMV